MFKRTNIFALAAAALTVLITGISCSPAIDPTAKQHDSLASERELIRETLSLYAIYLDDGRVDDFMDLFTEDAEFTAATYVYTGHDSIRNNLADKPRRPGKHLPFAAVIEFQSTTEARAWSDYLRVKITGDGDPSSWVVTSTGRYHDQLVKGDDGRWRFQRRDVYMPGRENPGSWTQPSSR